EQAVLSDEFRAALSQTGFRVVPESEFAAGEIRTVHDRVEALSRPIGRFRVARRVEAGHAITEKVLIHREFDRAHLGVDAFRPVGQPVERDASDRLIERVRDVEAAEMAGAVDAEITRLNAVRYGGGERGGAQLQIVVSLMYAPVA